LSNFDQTRKRHKSYRGSEVVGSLTLIVFGVSSVSSAQPKLPIRSTTKESHMDRIRTPFFITATAACALAVTAIAAQAQTALPIKAGLWQIHSEREVNGQKAPDVSERLKTMSPEKRQQFEAMMKRQGVEVGGGGVMRKVCYSREMLDRGRWPDQEGDCKTDFSSRSGSQWKWRATCPKSGYEGDGEAIFSGPENYVVKSSSVTKAGGQTRTSSTTITAKWMASDCGDLKPFQVEP
jgi:Protein of unknown function (DUF3617)